MGSSRTVTNTTESSSQRAEPTAEERQLTQLELERRKNVQPQLLGLDQKMLDFIMPLASGGSLPGLFASLGQGISEEDTQDIIKRSLSDIAPTFEHLGVLDSGPAAEISARLAGDIRTKSAMEKTRQRENLLNILQGFPASAQAPALQESQVLAQQLAGLRTITGSGSSMGTTRTPFLQTAFAGGLGQGIGAGIFSIPR